MKKIKDALNRIAFFAALLLIICTLLPIGCKHSPASPSLKQDRTQEDYSREFKAWLVSHTIDAYISGGHRDASWDKQAEMFLDKMCETYVRKRAVIPMDLLEKEGNSIVQLGSKDPAVGIWYGYALFCNKKYEKADMVLKEAMEALGNWEYPHSLAFFGSTFLRGVGEHVGARSKGEKEYWKGVQLQTICMAIDSGEFDHSQSPIAYRLISKNLSKDGLIQIAEAVEGIPSVDPWLAKMLAGESAITVAWKARGDDWGHTVSDGAWKEFHVHMEKAKSILVEAWKLHPEYPETAGRLITVSMAGHAPPNTDERHWFDQSVSAQIDYPEAYTHYLYSIMPRWGGSHDAMYQFGLECLNSDRFDTQIPLIYHYALVKIAGDHTHDRWRSVLRSPDVHNNLDRLFKEMRAHAEHEKDVRRLRLIEAATAAWSARYEKAESLLAEIDNTDDLENGFWGLKTTWQCRNLDELKTEIRAFTGPDKEILENAESLIHEGEFEKGISQLKKVMTANQTDRKIHDYLRHRIALTRFDKMASQINGTTPALHLAVEMDDLETAAFLIDSGFDVNAGNSKSNTALHYAATGGKLQFARWLLENGADVNSLNRSGWSPLQDAIHAKQVAVAQLLIQNGADVNRTIENGWNPLTSACYLNLEDVVQLAVEKGASVNHLTADQWSPLNLAIFYGAPETANLLIDAGCDINLPNGEKATPLEIALFKEYQELALTLIRKGAEIDAGPNPNFTPIHLATEKGFLEIVKELDHRGADLSSRLPTGETPLDLARQFGRDEVANYLIQRTE